MLVFHLYIVPFANGAGGFGPEILSHFGFLAGSILIFLKRRIGVLVSIGGIALMMGLQLYNLMSSPHPTLFDVRDLASALTDPYGFLPLSVGLILLVVGLVKVPWNRIRSGRKERAAKTGPLRVGFFALLPFVSVFLLYFVFLGDVRAGLSVAAGECLADNPNIREIYLGKSPDRRGTLYSVAVNHVTNKIYAPHSYNGTLAVLDGSTGNLLSTIELNPGPTSLNGVAVNVGTNKIYVTNNINPGKIFVIDGYTNTVVKTIPVGTYPNGIAIDDVANRVYVAELGNAITIIDGDEDVKIASVAAPIKPRFIAANPTDHKVYVSGSDGSSIVVLESEGTDEWKVSTIPLNLQGKSRGAGVTVNPTLNKVYVTGSGITVIDGTSNKVIHTMPGPKYGSAFQYSVNPRLNEVYAGAAGITPGRVLVIDSDTDTIKKELVVGSDLFGIAPNLASGKVYAADGYSGILYEISETDSCS
jgi:YVTN family beta-propeller protein